MTRKVVLVGHCGPDSAYLRMAVNQAAGKGAEVSNVDDQDRLHGALSEGVDLVLLNRQLPYGFDEEMAVNLIKRLKEQYPSQKLMLVSNYADAQAAAVEAGALPGFGKRELGTARVVELLREALGA